MEQPLVSVVCLCYNHERFVEESIDSVLNQSYKNVQLIVVDDASSDQSVNVIQRKMLGHPEITFVANKENLGNCRAFNRGWTLATGNFIIDLAADDRLEPSRIQKGIEAFSTVGPDFGINFGDVELVDETNRHIGFHSSRFPHQSIPQGDIYKELIDRYFINGPSMMIRREVLAKMNGYDEALAYEDFDFWIRSAREWKYVYTPEILVRRRILSSSMSSSQYRQGSPQLRTTLTVCRKIKELNRTAEEHKILGCRIRYEMRRAVMIGEWRLALDYLKLLRKLP